jgi:vitamin B12 transporter
LVVEEVLMIFLLAAMAAEAASEVDGSRTNEDIVVTAALEPVEEQESAASVTIIDRKRIDALGMPLVTDLLRLAPGMSVSVSGAQGSFTQVRIRGAEANHSLLFVDGIAFNDPAAGNEARFESQASDGLSRIEIVRGPQSALWGSEALGGVIALEGPDPLSGTRLAASGEYGSHDFGRANIAASTGSSAAGIAGTASWLRSDGIDIFGDGTGDRDGFRNVTVSLKGTARPGSDGEIGAVGRYVEADSQFDGTPPPFFTRADTLDASHSKIRALRAWARLGLAADAPWSFQLDGQYLHSSNRNRSGDAPLNRTLADRLRIGGKLVRRISAGPTRHVLIVAAEREDEAFAALDQAVFFAPDQRRSRGRTAMVGEWRADWGRGIATDIAVRRDDFNRFADETTLRASLLVRPAEGLSLHAAFGEGIAQPTFFDLYGFDPTSFVGNPALTPEKSRGYEAGLRWEKAAYGFSATVFSNRLTDEIVEDFSVFPFTVRNTPGKSRRRGIEAAAELRPVRGLRISANYSYIDALDRKAAGGPAMPEARRPKHSANVAADWTLDRFTLGGSLAYVGKRRDRDFDTFQDVVLDDYVLASLRVAYRLNDQLEAFARAENAWDADYQDVAGYNTPGRTVHAGLRLRFGS